MVAGRTFALLCVLAPAALAFPKPWELDTEAHPTLSSAPMVTARPSGVADPSDHHHHQPHATGDFPHPSGHPHPSGGLFPWMHHPDMSESPQVTKRADHHSATLSAHGYPHPSDGFHHHHPHPSGGFPGGYPHPSGGKPFAPWMGGAPGPMETHSKPSTFATATKTTAKAGKETAAIPVDVEERSDAAEDLVVPAESAKSKRGIWLL